MVKVITSEKTKNLQKDSQSKSTQKKYENDWLKFTKWTLKYHNFHPLDVDDDNQSAYSLTSNYMQWLHQEKDAIDVKGKSEKMHYKTNNVKQNPYYKDKYKPSTIERILASITWYYRNNYLTKKSNNPGFTILFNRKHKEITKTIKSIKNQEKDIKTLEAKALVKKDIIKIIDKINNSSEDLVNIRDKALILVGFYSMCRRSEILNIVFNDLEIFEDSIIINIRHSKTDQSGEGRKVLLPIKNDNYCPVNALKEWLETAQINSGPLFYKIKKSNNKDDFKRIEKYSLNKNNKKISLSDASFNLILKKRAFKAGFDMEGISGHSLRRGAITESRNKGVPLHRIKAQSGHRSSEMVDKYSEVENIREESAAKEI